MIYVSRRFSVRTIIRYSSIVPQTSRTDHQFNFEFCSEQQRIAAVRIDAQENKLRHLLKQITSKFGTMQERSCGELSRSKRFELLAQNYEAYEFQYILCQELFERFASMRSTNVQNKELIEWKLSHQTSQRLLQKSVELRDSKSIVFLREILSMTPSATIFDLHEDDFERVVDNCLSARDLRAAHGWMRIMQDVFNLVPSGRFLSKLMTFAVVREDWDFIYFLSHEMEMRGISMTEADACSILQICGLRPANRWRCAFRLAHTSLTSADGYASSVVARALQIIQSAQQPRAVRVFYGQIFDRGSGEEQSGLESMPDFNSQIFESFAIAAVILKDFEWFAQLFRYNYVRIRRNFPESKAISSDTNTSNPFDELLPFDRAQLGDAVVSRSELHQLQFKWIAQCSQILEDEFEYDKGRHCGLLISWMLCSGVESHAQSKSSDLWNSFLHGLKSSEGTEKNHTLQNAFLDALNVIASVALKDSSLATLQRTSNFLKNVVLGLNEDSILKNSDLQICSLGSCLQANGNSAPASRSIDVVKLMMDIFTLSKEPVPASVLLSMLLRQGVVLSESRITQVLQLLQLEEDHGAVIEIFELLLPVMRTSTSSRWMKKSLSKERSDAWGEKLAPLLFSTAISSYAELQQHDRILHILLKELPQQGLLPRIGMYITAMKCCCASGYFAAGANLFDVALSSHRSYLGDIDFASTALAESALECCRKGRLGATALQIYALRKEAIRRNGAGDTTGRSLRVIDAVFGALASEEMCVILPQFISVLAEEDRPLLATERVIESVVSIACIYGDDFLLHDVVSNLEDINRQSLSDMATATGLKIAVKRLFNDNNVEAVENTQRKVLARANVHPSLKKLLRSIDN